MRKVYLTALIIILLSVSGLFGQNTQGIKVENIAICTAVENRQPMGTDSVFSADAGKLYCFTKIASQADSTEISHVWYYKDKEMARIILPVKAKTWRTWSAKTIMPEWKGNWRVEIQDSDGDVITSLSFRVK
jgi:hypothetical protein